MRPKRSQRPKPLAPRPPREEILQRIIGESPAMQQLREEISFVAPTDARVLITGETGSGKNLVARVLHDLHPQRHGFEFRSTNVGALVPELAAAQLFGNVAGAYTDAKHAVEGIAVEADRGSLFLDEVSTAPPNVQVMLLTLIETRQINPVGAPKDYTRPQVDLRFIAASSSTPRQLLGMPSFRNELFYRLAEYVIELPPLRERGDDVLILAERFLVKASKQFRREDDGFAPLQKISAAAKDRLLAHTWPGNVRELEQVIRAAVVRSRQNQNARQLESDWVRFPVSEWAGAGEGGAVASVFTEHFRAHFQEVLRGKLAAPPEADSDYPAKLLEHYLQQFRYELCRLALQHTARPKSAVARMLGIDIKSLNRYSNRQTIDEP